MVALDRYQSWSQHESTPEEPMLNFTLICIIAAFVIRSFTYQGRRWKVIGRMRVSHSNRLTAGLFAGVLVFSVNHPAAWVQTLHMVFTGAAIGSAYVEVVSRDRFGFIGAICGVGLFVLGYWFEFYSVGTGEVLAAFPIVLHILTNSKNDE